MIQSGLIKLTKRSASGEEVAVALRSPGALIGIESVIIRRHFLYDAVPLTEATVMIVPSAVVYRELEPVSDCARAVQEALATQLVETTDEVAARGGKDDLLEC